MRDIPSMRLLDYVKAPHRKPMLLPGFITRPHTAGVQSIDVDDERAWHSRMRCNPITPADIVEGPHFPHSLILI
jgi:hypothetical protein